MQPRNPTGQSSHHAPRDEPRAIDAGSRKANLAERDGDVTVRGEVMRVDPEGRFSFVRPLERMPPGFELEPGRGFFLHKSQNGHQVPNVGDRGKFEIWIGEKGVCGRTVAWESAANPAPAAPRPSSPSRNPGPRGETRHEDREDREPAHDSFIHPYNFVSIPPHGLKAAVAKEPLFARTDSAKHDRYRADRKSGRIDCVIEMHSPWFVPHAAKRAVDQQHQQHQTLGYFTLDQVSDWKADRPQDDPTRPAIPASSLRGMVRGVFETLTLSCFSIFDPGRLDFRIGYDLEQGGGAKYLPARVIEISKDGGRVQFLDGRAPHDPPNTLRTALVSAYRPRVLEVRRRGNEPEKKLPGSPDANWRLLKEVKDGTPVAAVVDLAPRPKVKEQRTAYHFRESHAVLPLPKAEAPPQLDELAAKLGPGRTLIFGYLHRTGPNIENKHHERIFFRWNADYNGPHATGNVRERFQRFLADSADTVIVDKEVVQNARAGLERYADEHGEEVRKLKVPAIRSSSLPPYPSDFVEQRPEDVRIEPGDLFYALVKGGPAPEVRGLYPVALPRLSHEETRGDLLPKDFRPCNDPTSLCPACRAFGWVRASEQELTKNEKRIDAVAGHVRFTHGTLIGDWPGQQSARKQTLAILGSPKPTTTEFYLNETNRSARKTRWPPVLSQKVGRPLYRTAEATLRGRKFYRRHPENVALKLGRDGDEGSNQNATVHLLPEKLRFQFAVHFDNLTDDELAALVLSLSLKLPNSWSSDGTAPTFRHALGHGRPLGMGACSIDVTNIRIDDPTTRPASPTFAAPPQFSSPLLDFKPYQSAVERQWQAAERHDAALKQVRQELHEMLRSAPAGIPIHYPYLPSSPDKDNYEWFVQSRKRRAGPELRLPAPGDERKGLRLPLDPTQQGC